MIQAISNLIDNAMKFGPPGGRVTLSLARDGDATVVTIADDGAGVPPAERPLVTQLSIAAATIARARDWA